MVYTLSERDNTTCRNRIHSNQKTENFRHKTVLIVSLERAKMSKEDIVSTINVQSTPLSCCASADGGFDDFRDLSTGTRNAVSIGILENS